MATSRPSAARRFWKRFTVARYHSVGRRKGGLSEATLPGLISLEGSRLPMRAVEPALSPRVPMNWRRVNMLEASRQAIFVPSRPVLYLERPEHREVETRRRSYRVRIARQYAGVAGLDFGDLFLT